MPVSARSSDNEQFVVNVQVRVVGPAAEWDAVAQRLVDRLSILSLGGNYSVQRAEVDTATEADAS